MNHNNHRIPPARIVVLWKYKPALHVKLVAIPVNAFGFAPRRMLTSILARYLFPRSYSSGPDLGWTRQRLLDQSAGSTALGHSRIEGKTARRDSFWSRQECSEFAGSRVNGGESRVPVHVLAKQDLVRLLPGDPARRCFHSRRDVLGLASSSRHNIDVPTSGTLIAHYAANECYRLTVCRPARDRKLEIGGRLKYRLCFAGCDRHAIELGDPPVVVARTVCRGDRKSLAVPGPVVFVAVEVCGGELSELFSLGVYYCQPLLVDMAFYHSRLRCHRLEGAGCSWRALGK